MQQRKKILLKLTGELLNYPDAQPLIRSIAQQIRALSHTHYFSIIIGGGNFFRGSQHGKALGITPQISHHVGMLATLMNGLMLRDIFAQEGVVCELLSALVCPNVATTVSPQAIVEAYARDACMIFVGGIGTPFFTTDTTAVIRGLQLPADEVWKATKVDGVYTADPMKDASAQYLARVSYSDALSKKLHILDATALILAQEQRMTIRVFSLFGEQALMRAAQDPHFGSTLYAT